MAFKLKSTFGDHNIYEYDTIQNPFLQFFQKLYNHTDLSNLNLGSNFDFNNINNINNINDVDLSNIDTDLHKKFYSYIKSNDEFKILYTNMIIAIFNYFYPDEQIMIFQSYPSIRIQFFNNIVVPPHYDSDDLGKHPIGEKNFILPITKMFGTNTIFIESHPNSKDFKGIQLEYGDLFFLTETNAHIIIKKILKKTFVFH
jgi:hypothetical protein